MRAQVVTCRDPFRPANRRTAATVTRRRKLAAMAPKGKPAICQLNGRWLPRAEWRRRLQDGDVVVFVQLPQGGGGGGGSNPMRIVLTLAVMYFAGPIAGTMFEAGTMAYTMATAAINIAGSLLINALIPPPKPTAAQAFSSGGGLASPSPTYSLQGQGNSARIGQPIPVIYGRHLVYPDFAAMPYTEYAGNEQFLYQLLLIGQGHYTIESIRVEDTDLDSFAEITTETVPPGGTLTLFPANVVTSTEVSGQEALTSTTLGPFVANAAGTQANALAIDMVMPRGLYYANDSGGLNAVSCAWTAEARPIDDSGTPTGAWATLGTESHNAATTTPQRVSRRYSVSSGRYEVRLTRTDTKQTDSRYGHELLWAGLRSYLPGAQDYGDVTLLALRMRATNNLSSQAARKINCIVTRKLPAWSPGGGWTANAATRSIAWAFADIARSDYGAALADARIDLQGLYDLDIIWSGRNDRFDGIFDSQATVMEALTQVARAGRALPYLQGGILHCVRDGAESIPVALFSQRNILAHSLSIDYLLPGEDTADAVDVTYFDSSVWAERTVRAEVGSGSGVQPARVRLFGVTGRDQAWREGRYIAACNRYRRRLLKFGTEMEGFIPALGDLIAVQHDMPRWGQSGDIVAFDSISKIATLAEPVTFGVGTHVLAFRKRDGSVAGPYTAIAGVDDYHVELTTWSGSEPTPDTGSDRERSQFAFGASNAQYILARVLGVRPQSSETVEISAVVESDYVHTADSGAAPGLTAWQLPSRFTVPVVSGLQARSMPDSPERMVISWQPAPGADYYIVEQSNGDSDDDGVWTRSGDTAAASYTATALYGPATWVRVAAVGLTRGPYVKVAYELVASYFWGASDTNDMWSTAPTNFWRY